MKQRITEADLQAICDKINTATGSPLKPWTSTTDGDSTATIGSTANVGCYHISCAYGGVALHRVHNSGGAISNPLGGGYMPKRELYERLQAFLSGLSHTKE